MTQPGTIRLTREVPFPPALVWPALTDSTAMSKWWAPGDVRPVVGHRFSLDMGSFGKQECEVLEVVPEQLFVFAFGIDMLDTTITWRLEERDGGTHLTFEQAGFDLDSPIGTMAYEGMSRGWPSLLERIDTAITSES